MLLDHSCVLSDRSASFFFFFPVCLIEAPIASYSPHRIQLSEFFINAATSQSKHCEFQDLCFLAGLASVLKTRDNLKSGVCYGPKNNERHQSLFGFFCSPVLDLRASLYKKLKRELHLFSCQTSGHHSSIFRLLPKQAKPRHTNKTSVTVMLLWHLLMWLKLYAEFL